MVVPRGNRIIEHLNKQVRVRICDGVFEGLFRAFDKHMNIVLGAAQEVRLVRSRSEASLMEEQRRTLGTIVLRGEFVVSMTVIGPGTAKIREEAGDAPRMRSDWPPKPSRRQSPSPNRDRKRRESPQNDRGQSRDRSSSTKKDDCKTQ